MFFLEFCANTCMIAEVFVVFYFVLKNAEYFLFCVQHSRLEALLFNESLSYKDLQKAYYQRFQQNVLLQVYAQICLVLPFLDK